MPGPTFGDKTTGVKPRRRDPVLDWEPALDARVVGPLICRVCGDIGQGVQQSVRNVKDTDLGRGGFRAFPCCQDRQACRERRHAQGKSWPLIDGSHSPAWLEQEEPDGGS